MTMNQQVLIGPILADRFEPLVHRYVGGLRAAQIDTDAIKELSVIGHMGVAQSGVRLAKCGLEVLPADRRGVTGDIAIVPVARGCRVDEGNGIGLLYRDAVTVGIDATALIAYAYPCLESQARAFVGAQEMAAPMGAQLAGHPQRGVIHRQ